MTNIYVSYDDLLSVMSRETLDKIPIIDISVIDEEIQKYEYLSLKYLQESDIKTGLINYKRMSDIAEGIAIALKEIKKRLIPNAAPRDSRFIP